MDIIKYSSLQMRVFPIQYPAELLWEKKEVGVDINAAPAGTKIDSGLMPKS